MSDLFQASDVRAEFGKSGYVLRYSIQIWHKGLKQHRQVSARDPDVLQNKVAARRLKWEEQWERAESKQNSLDQKEASLQEAERGAQEAKQALQDLEDLLLHTLGVDDAVDWEALKDRSGFPEPQPPEPSKPKIQRAPSEPSRNDAKYQPRLNFFDNILPSLKRRKTEAAHAVYRNDLDQHRADVKRVDSQNRKTKEEYDAAYERWQGDIEGWTLRKQEFQRSQEAYNAKIDALKARYRERDPEAVLENCELVLNKSQYPDFFSKDFELDYDADTKILVLDYALPSVDAFPTVTDVKYIAARKEMKETHLAESKLHKLYDDTLYKVTLRTIHELFEADTA